MAAQNKKEEVSVSFHYLNLLQKRNEPKSRVPISSAQFESVFECLQAAKALDLGDEKVLSLVKNKQIAPITSLERLDKRTICGVFKASSYGHSFENHLKGNIPANSVNLRPFIFYLYLSQSGRIYIASQYLGLYGGYIQIRNTVIDAFPNKSLVEASSFNLAHLDLQNTEIKEIEFQFSRKSKSSSSGNAFGKYGSLALKVAENGPSFEKAVRTSILDKYPFSHSSDVRKALTSLLKKDDLIELKDEDIDSCRLLVRSNKKDKYIHLIAGLDFASRFTIDVPMKRDGHPAYDPTKSKIEHLLKTQILAKKEDV